MMILSLVEPEEKILSLVLRPDIVNLNFLNRAHVSPLFDDSDLLPVSVSGFSKECHIKVGIDKEME